MIFSFPKADATDTYTSFLYVIPEFICVKYLVRIITAMTYMDSSWYTCESVYSINTENATYLDKMISTLKDNRKYTSKLLSYRLTSERRALSVGRSRSSFMFPLSSSTVTYNICLISSRQQGFYECIKRPECTYGSSSDILTSR